jgi:hypothetical protein
MLAHRFGPVRNSGSILMLSFIIEHHQLSNHLAAAIPLSLVPFPVNTARDPCSVSRDPFGHRV